jgi:GDP-4-dehydro-6-deoxy-D-mannose reductase
VTTALLTGSSGFVGTHLRSVLRSAGWDVVGLGRAAAEPEPGERYIRADVTNLEDVCAALEAVQPDVVFHLAAASSQKVPAATEVVRTAVDGTLVICSAIRRAGLPSRLILAGSSAQYGGTSAGDEPIGEDTPCRPVSAYGHAKLAAESVAFALASDGAFELVPARPFNHVGPGESPATVAGSLAERVVSVMEGRAERVRIADVTAVRDFTDVRDIAHGYLALAERGIPGRVYNLCSGRASTVLDILHGLLREAGLDESIVDIVPGKVGGVARQVGSPARVRADTGWVAEIPLSRSLADLLAGVRGVPAAATS